MEHDTQWGQRLHAILEGALYVWRVEGEVVREGNDACVIRGGDAGRVTVERIASEGEAPYWEVSSDVKDALPPLPYAGIHGMLRAVRTLLDPDGAAERLVVGAARD